MKGSVLALYGGILLAGVESPEHRLDVGRVSADFRYRHQDVFGPQIGMRLQQVQRIRTIDCRLPHPVAAARHILAKALAHGSTDIARTPILILVHITHQLLP